MWLLPLTVPVGVGVGLLAGGHLSNVLRAPVRWWGLLLGTLVVGVIVALSPEPPGGDLLLPFSLVLFLALALRNLQWSGAGVIAVGIALNLVPVLVNGYMPVRPETIVQAELAGPTDYEQVQLGTGRRLAEPDDRLTALGPIIPAPLVNEMFSFGDLIVMAGLLNLGFRAVKPKSPHRGRRSPRHAAGRHAGDSSSDPDRGDADRPGEPVLVGP